MVKRAPDVVESFVDRPHALLADRHHGVLLAATALASAVMSVDPDAAVRYATDLPGPLARLLRGLAGAGGASPEHDVGGVCDPFLQVAVLRLLRELQATGGVSVDDGHAVADVLAQARDGGWVGRGLGRLGA